MENNSLYFVSLFEDVHMKHRIIYTLFYLFCGFALNAQPVSDFCKDSSIYAQPDFIKMSAWIVEIDQQIWTSPLEALHHFFSTEVMNYDWKKYPCLTIFYNHKL